jgi:AraC-like DNA-binding protein
MVLETGEVELKPGTCFWMQPGRRYEAEQHPVHRLGVSYLHFTLHVPWSGLPLSAFEAPFEVMHTRQVEFVDTVMRRIVALSAEEAAKAVAEEMFGALLMELVREHAASARTGMAEAIDQRHREIVERIATEIRESPAEAGAVEELARAAGYSVDHFSRVFLKITGARPQDYVINARLARARQLLVESEFTVGAVAEAVGFRNIFFFSRQFRQRTGQTPSEFRRGARAKIFV